MRSNVTLACALLSALCSTRAQAQEEVTIKLGTLVPQGSIWHQLLKQGAQDIEQQTGGKVHLKIFAGGTMGNEGDMVKKMRIGQLQAAALSTIGLHEITPEPLALDIPMLVRSAEERDYVLGKIGGRLEDALLKKGYVVLSWSEIGFTRFFSTKPRPTLAEMRQGKIFVWEGDPASEAAWKAGGFHTVVLSSTDIIPSLQTGMIDTVVYPQTYALALQVHTRAKFMHDLVWSSFNGATVLDKKTWDRLGKDTQQKLQKITRDLGEQTMIRVRKLEDESLKKMKAQGLQVVAVKDLPEWDKALQATHQAVRGKVVPADLFDEVQRLVKEYRAKQAQK